MNDNLVSGLIEGAKVLASVQSDRARYDYLASTYAHKSRPASAVSAEVTLPGVKLNNYTNRTQLEGENSTHVKIVEHKEYLEKVPVPPTPPTEEELARAREDKKFLAKLWAGVATVGIVVTGTVIVIANQQNKPKLPSIES